MTRDQALLRALRDKINIGLLCATAGVSAALASWLTVMIGTILLSCVLLWSTDRHRRRIQKEPPRIPDPAVFDHGLIRGTVEAIGEAQRERLDALDACPEGMLSTLDGILVTASQAEAAALSLARRTDDLHRYLSTKDLSRVRARLYAAQECARASRSPTERESYEAAAAAYELEAETLSAIDRSVRVAIARLENIRATLAAVPPRIVKLRTASAEVGDASFTRLSRELCAAGSDLDEAESHLLAFAQAGEREIALDTGPRGPFLARVHVAHPEGDLESLAAEEALSIAELSRPRQSW